MELTRGLRGRAERQEVPTATGDVSRVMNVNQESRKWTDKTTAEDGGRRGSSGRLLLYLQARETPCDQTYIMLQSPVPCAPSVSPAISVCCLRGYGSGKMVALETRRATSWSTQSTGQCLLRCGSSHGMAVQHFHPFIPTLTYF